MAPPKPAPLLGASEPAGSPSSWNSSGGREIPRIPRITTSPSLGASVSSPSRSRSKDSVLRRTSTAEGGLSGMFLQSQLVPIHPKWGRWGSLGRMTRFLGTWPAMLLWWMGMPGKWFKQLCRMVLFVTLMLPGFVPPFLGYLTSKRIIKNVAYGPRFRHQLDVYLPCNRDETLESGQPRKAPVVIFVSGGAWVIGYKLWAFIMGQLFQSYGVLFIAPDYRNFPETTVGGMVEDVIQSVGWVFKNMQRLGGDPANVTLMGQSAGAHISAMTMLEQATRGARATSKSSSLPPLPPYPSPGGATTGAQPPAVPEPLQWRVTDLARWVGISGPYDIMEFVPKIRKRGLPKKVMLALMEQDYARFSPIRRIRDLAIADPTGILRSFPPCHVFHGTADQTVSWEQSEAYADGLRKASVDVQTKYYEGKSHTDPILEDPCEGDGDELMSDLLQLVSPGETSESAGIWSLQPKLLLKWAKMANPFS